MDLLVWKIWDNVHDDDAQIKRLKSAKKAECTPLSIDHDECIGVFSGSSSKYKTSLTNCTCKDFSIKRKPCKHMYRLAIELGIINTDIKSDLSKVQKPSSTAKSWDLEQAIEIIETLEPDLQIKLKEIIMPALFKRQYVIPVLLSNELTMLLSNNFLREVENPKLAGLALKRNQIIKILDDANVSGFKRNLKKEVLLEWISENVLDFKDLISPYATCVEISEEFKKSARKTYTYLIRKYDTEEIYNPETDTFIKIPKGAELVISIDALTGEQNSSYKFPQDEVTRLLEKYKK